MARIATIEPNSDPVDEIVREDRENVAEELATAIASINGISSGNIKGYLSRVPRGGGRPETIETLYPPFDPDAIIEDLKERFGGGDYNLRIMETGKPGVRKNIQFSIAKERASLIAPREEKTDMTMMMFQMMMKQSDDAARQRADDMRDRQSASERQMQLMATMATAIIPALMGGREKTSELMTAIAAMQPKPQENDLEKTVNTFAALKTIFKDDTSKEGFNADDMVGSIVRAAGPIAGAVGKAFSGSRGGAAQEPEVPQLEGGAQPLRLPHNPAPPSGNEPEPTNQILRLIRPDVLYFFGRRHAPDLAAEAVYDVIVRAGITDEEINGTFAPYAFSDDKWNALAAEGIDLRADISWADEFIAELAKLFMGGENAPFDERDDADDIPGAGGSPPDVADHGEVGAKG